MRQIKNYLSNIYDIKTVLLCSKTKEYAELEEWLSDKKGMKVIHSIEEENIDALIFDWDCETQLQRFAERKPRYLIGRMRKSEDYFKVWERYRGISEAIYIEQDRELPPKEINADVAPVEILDWHKEKNNDVELSVILPVYNVAACLSKCIETLLKWQAPYVEYLFINDGSTDGSRDIILKYAENDRRVRLIDKENGGCASARNRGIAEARGRWIGFVDSDDFIDESMFYKLFRRAIMGNYSFTYSGYNEYYEEDGNSEPVFNDCLSDPYLTGTYREDKVRLLAVKTRVAVWRALYRKDIIEQNHIRFHEDMKRFDDLPFRVEYIFAAGSAVCVPEYLYYYRLGRKGQDVSCNDKRLFVHFKMFEHLDRYVDAYKDRCLQDLLQVVKIQTHGYALSKLDQKYRKEYIKRARKQLDRNMGYWRTVVLLLMYTGKGNLGWYTRMKLSI